MRVKKLLCSILAICMVLSTMTFTAFADSIDCDIDTAITLTENTEITTAVTLSETITVSGDVTISGGTITRAEGMTAPMFIVEAGSTLTLENITIDGGAVWAYEVSEDEPTDIETTLGRGSVNNGIQAGAVVIDNSGTVVISEGAVLQNNDTTVINSNSGAKVTIAGGTVCNNNGSVVNAPNANNVVNVTAGKVYGNKAAGGGLTYVKGVSTIDGGEFYNNYAGIGGVFRLVSGANVVINDGKFYNNASAQGGVAYVYCWSGSSKFTVNGGEFYNNYATEGGVGYTNGKNCYITINDGNIHHNSAYTGGAFKLEDYAYFTMNGGTIANNSAETLGGALRQWGSWGTSFNGGVVRDNTAVDGGNAIWTGNGLFLSGTEFINNDIHASDYIRVDEDFKPFVLAPTQTADVRGNGDYVLTQEDLAKISVNSLGKFTYYNEETKRIEYVNEYVTILKDGEQVQVKSVEQAVELAQDGDKVVILSDVSDKNILVNKNLDIVSGGRARTLPALNNVIFTVEANKEFSLDGFVVRGLSYIFAKTPKSISVTNCDVDVTVAEEPSSNCPPAFIRFSGSQGGSVSLNVQNSVIKTAVDASEDWHKVAHGISGWNYISAATITGNTFGSEAAPLSAAAIKLMNFTANAEVTVENNTFYVNSKDANDGPNAVQFYQCNSRANAFYATVANNEFYVDDATYAVGINSAGQGNSYVTIARDNLVNGNPISISDVVAFGGNISQAPQQAGYIGVAIETDASGKIAGGVFGEATDALRASLADGYVLEEDSNGYFHVVEETLLVDEIKIDFELASEDEGEKVYNINLTTDGKIINRLNSADLTFLFSQIEGDNEYEIIASNEEVAINAVDNSKVRYEFHYNGKTNVSTDTNVTINLGQVKFTGYGKFSFVVDTNANGTNAAHTTKLFDNIVDTFVPGGILADGTAVGKFDVSDETIKNITIAVPDRNLAITVDFPNAIVDNVIAYQDMKVVISGGDLAEDITIDLGTDAVATELDIFGKVDAEFVAEMIDGSYVINVTDALTLNNAYTVTVSGAGYRTARYTVTMTEDKALRFWNNVMDEAQVVEIGKDSSAVNVTFLAGDIVKDNKINIYDLSAVVSYFGTETSKTAYDAYAKYDLNRDGVIDSKDVAYVLVSWDN